MSREFAVTMMLLAAVVVLGLMLWGWLRRRRRDAAIAAPIDARAEAERSAADGYHVTGLYVASTAHDAPLDRLVIAGLAFRSKVEVTVTPVGVALALVGEKPVLLGAETLIGAGRATWTVDRVVEPDGLVMIAWRTAGGTVVDSYLRLQGNDPSELVAQVDALIPKTSILSASSSPESPA